MNSSIKQFTHKCLSGFLMVVNSVILAVLTSLMSTSAHADFWSSEVVVDFNQVSPTNYTTNQNGIGSFYVENNGRTLQMVGNRWIKINFPYEVNAETVLEFTFHSWKEAEIASIGFEEDNSWTEQRAFKLYGTQAAGNMNTLADYATSGREGRATRYVVPVGQFYTGSMNYMFFMLDNDANVADANVRFTDVVVHQGCDRSDQGKSCYHKDFSDSTLSMRDERAGRLYPKDYLEDQFGNKLFMQTDNNLVLYTSSGVPVYASNTSVGGSNEVDGYAELHPSLGLTVIEKDINSNGIFIIQKYTENGQNDGSPDSRYESNGFYNWTIEVDEIFGGTEEVLLFNTDTMDVAWSSENVGIDQNFNPDDLRALWLRQGWGHVSDWTDQDVLDFKEMFDTHNTETDDSDNMLTFAAHHWLWEHHNDEDKFLGDATDGNNHTGRRHLRSWVRTGFDIARDYFCGTYAPCAVAQTLRSFRPVKEAEDATKEYVHFVTTLMDHVKKGDLDDDMVFNSFVEEVGFTNATSATFLNELSMQLNADYSTQFQRSLKSARPLSTDIPGGDQYHPWWAGKFAKIMGNHPNWRFDYSTASTFTLTNLRSALQDQLDLKNYSVAFVNALLVRFFVTQPAFDQLAQTSSHAYRVELFFSATADAKYKIGPRQNRVLTTTGSAGVFVGNDIIIPRTLDIVTGTKSTGDVIWADTAGAVALIDFNLQSPVKTMFKSVAGKLGSYIKKLGSGSLEALLGTNLVDDNFDLSDVATSGNTDAALDDMSELSRESLGIGNLATIMEDAQSEMLDSDGFSLNSDAWTDSSAASWQDSLLGDAIDLPEDDSLTYSTNSGLLPAGEMDGLQQFETYSDASSGAQNLVNDILVASNTGEFSWVTDANGDIEMTTFNSSVVDQGPSADNFLFPTMIDTDGDSIADSLTSLEVRDGSGAVVSSYTSSNFDTDEWARLESVLADIENDPAGVEGRIVDATPDSFVAPYVGEATPVSTREIVQALLGMDPETQFAKKSWETFAFVGRMLVSTLWSDTGVQLGAGVGLGTVANVTRMTDSELSKLIALSVGTEVVAPAFAGLAASFSLNPNIVQGSMAATTLGGSLISKPIARHINPAQVGMASSAFFYLLLDRERTDAGFLNIFNSTHAVRAQVLYDLSLWNIDKESNNTKLTFRSAEFSNNDQGLNAYSGADRAIDGNTDGQWKWDATNSVAHSSDNIDPWLSADLGAVREINRLEVINRKDCCEERLRGMDVIFSKENLAGLDYSSSITHPSTSHVQTIKANDVVNGKWIFKPSPDVEARFVKLHANFNERNTAGTSNTPLNIAEIVAFTNAEGVGHSEGRWVVTRADSSTTINSLALADAALAGTNATVWSFTRDVLDMHDNSGGGTRGLFQANNEFSDTEVRPGTTTSVNQSNFVINARGEIYIPKAGTYTFAVTHDDGFRMTVDGTSFQFDGTTPTKTTWSSQNFTSAGIYPVDVTFFEGSGQANFEVSIADGNPGDPTLNRDEYRLLTSVCGTLAYTPTEECLGYGRRVWSTVTGVDGIDAGGKIISLPAFASAAENPVFVADMQTFNGADPAGVRYSFSNPGSVTVYAEEEDSDGTGDFTHASETLGYIALDEGLLEDRFNRKIGEARNVKVTQGSVADATTAFNTVELMSSYKDPVAIGTMSIAGADPADVRFKDVGTHSEMKVQVEEWQYKAPGAHATADLSYIVMESGIHKLANGDLIKAGKLTVSNTVADDNWTVVTIGGGSSFSGTPIILINMQNDTTALPLVVRIRNVTSSGFEVKLQPEEAQDASAGTLTEEIGIMAIGPG